MWQKEGHKQMGLTVRVEGGEVLRGHYLEKKVSDGSRTG